MIEKIFNSLGVPENAVRIYDQLLTSGSLSARQLSEQLSLPRPSVYDQLKKLMKQGFVVERDEEHTKVFQVDDVRKLPEMLREKISELETDEKALRKELPSLMKQSQTVAPRMKFYPGVDGVKQVMNEALWDENVEIVSMWPINEMVSIIGRPFHENWHRRRIRRNVIVRTVWPRDKRVSVTDYPYLGTGKQFLRWQRLAPEGMTWDMGYLLYGNKVGFISPKREAFGFTLQSQSFADLMRVQFDVMWKLSKPDNVLAKDSEKFLATV